MKSYPTKFKIFLWKIVQMGTLQKLQNSIQTHIIFWPVYPIHTNSQEPMTWAPKTLYFGGYSGRATILPFSSSKYFYSW